MSLSDPVTRKPHSRILPIYAHIICGRASVLMRERCDTFYTSGFVDDVVFAHYGQWRVMGSIFKRRSNTTSIKAEIPTKFCSVIKTTFTSGYRELRTGSEVCYLRMPCLIFVKYKPHVDLSDCRVLACRKRFVLLSRRSVNK